MDGWNEFLDIFNELCEKESEGLTHSLWFMLVQADCNIVVRPHMTHYRQISSLDCTQRRRSVDMENKQ
jgi:hypothetical protein